MRELMWFILGSALTCLLLLSFYPSIRAHFPLYLQIRWAIRCLLGNRYCSFRDAFASAILHSTPTEWGKRQQNIVLKDASQNGATLWETPHGNYWLPKGADVRFAAIMVWEQSRDIYTYRDCGVKRGDIVIDCGANIGAFTRKALSKGAELVIALEPSTSNLECLRRNLEAEIDQGRVIVCQRGVWDKNGQVFLEMTSPINPGCHAIVETSENKCGEWVDVTTIDNLVRELKLHRVDFIKMDIEGSEQRAVAGAKNTLKNFKPRLAIATEHGNVSQNVGGLIDTVRQFQLGYRSGGGTCMPSGWWGVVPIEIFFY